MTTFIRGQTILWTITFKDANNDVFNPDTADLRVRFYDGTDREVEEIEMNQTGNVWTGTWDSNIAYSGLVTWSVRTTGGGSLEAIDGEFELLANTANEDPPEAP